MGSGHVSHRWTSSFDDHLDQHFILLKKCTTALRSENKWRLWQRTSESFINISVSSSFKHGVGISQAVSQCFLGWCACVLRRMYHVYHHIRKISARSANQQPEKQLRILWNCETTKFASCTSNLWEQMFNFRRYIGFSPKLILSLERDPIDNAELYYPHDNIVGNHSSHECMKSHVLSVCHELLTILWLIVPVCLPIRECQV